MNSILPDQCFEWFEYRYHFWSHWSHPDSMLLHLKGFRSARFSGAWIHDWIFWDPEPRVPWCAPVMRRVWCVWLYHLCFKTCGKTLWTVCTCSYLLFFCTCQILFLKSTLSLNLSSSTQCAATEFAFGWNNKCKVSNVRLMQTSQTLGEGQVSALGWDEHCPGMWKERLRLAFKICLILDLLEVFFSWTRKLKWHSNWTTLAPEDLSARFGTSF